MLAAFGLPGPVRAMVRVPGAWSNRVWRLTTGSAAYAVKQLLNPFGEPRWRERLAEAWSYEQIACAADVSMPEPMPNPADGGCLADVPTVSTSAAVPVRVHRWVDGVAPGDGPVGAEVAAWAGGTLATLHQLDVRAVDRTCSRCSDRRATRCGGSALSPPDSSTALGSGRWNACLPTSPGWTRLPERRWPSRRAR